MLVLNALSLDFLGFGVYTFPAGEAGAMSFHDPLEGTEIKLVAHPVDLSSPKEKCSLLVARSRRVALFHVQVQEPGCTHRKTNSSASS